MGLEERFWAKVAPEPNTGCWLWTASVDGGGYGKIVEHGVLKGAHRVSYELNVGTIPEGLDLDHLCRVRSCVNPDHLEPVTRSENCRRGFSGQAAAQIERAKTHCPQGHLYEGENVRVFGGSRYCVACDRARMKARGKEYSRRYREKKRCRSGTS